MSKDKAKIKQEIKEVLLNNLIQLGILVLFGFLCGYLLWRNASRADDENGKAYFLFSVVLFSVIGIIIYLVKSLKKIKRIKQDKNNEEIQDE